jgi:hypothetical protein
MTKKEIKEQKDKQLEEIELKKDELAYKQKITKAEQDLALHELKALKDGLQLDKQKKETWKEIEGAALSPEELQELTDTSEATPEYQALLEVGAERRNSTGYIALQKEIKADKLKVDVTKRLAVIISSVGFMFMMLMMTKQDLGNNSITCITQN